MADKLIVAIATRDRASLLKRTLESLAGCRLPREYRGTWVVDGEGSEVTREIVGDFEATLDTRYLHHPDDNKSRALNAVLARCEDALIFFTDDDVWIEPETLQAYSEAAAGMSSGGFFGGPTRAEYEREPADWLKRYLPASAVGFSLQRDQHHGERVEAAKPDSSPWRVPEAARGKFLGHNWAAFRSDLVAAGRFDPRFGPGSTIGCTGQETTMQERLTAAGLPRFFVPRARVRHHVPADRCSRRWAVHRSYRDGLQHGLSGRRAGLPGARELVRESLGLLLDAPRKDPELRFRRVFRLYYAAGVIRGRRVARRSNGPDAR